MKHLIQVVPHLPPSINGLGDYALLLAKKLRLAHEIHSHFVVVDPDWQDLGCLDGFAVSRMPTKKSSALRNLLETISERDTTVLLHYVGYGYAKRGCPFWLVEGLERWRRREGERRLVTMFHELYATGPIWSSSFWNSRFQKCLAKRLADVSDHCRTSMQRNARILGQLSNRHCGRITVLPVFSNAGELRDVGFLGERKRQMVIFGSSGWRSSIYQNHLQRLVVICKSLHLDRVIDIGPRVGTLVNLPVPLFQHGPLPAAEISQILADSMFGILNYPASCLGKSGIFAAYCAHGLFSVLFDPSRNEDGVAPGREYGLAEQIERGMSPLRIMEVSTAAHSWYRSHNIASTASAYATVFREIAGRHAEKAVTRAC